MKYTIYVPISREQFFIPILKSLEMMDFPAQDTELLIVLDTADKRFAGAALKVLEMFSTIKPVKVIKVKVTGEAPLPDDAPIIMRRQRVMSVWNHMKTMIGKTEIFFSFEDDTKTPDDAFKKLTKRVEKGAVFAEGVEMHRQTDSIGAWKLTKLMAKTLKYKDRGISRIDGGGWYCFATRSEYVKKTMIRESGAAMGPDVCFVYDLSKMRKGRAIIDWSVKCGHATSEGMLYASKNTGQLCYKGKKNNRGEIEWSLNIHTTKKQKQE